VQIVIGCDHKGFLAKAGVMDMVRRLGHDVTEAGTFDDAPVDFPDIAVEVCRPVADGRAERAILVCSTGIGAVMAANKIPGIRAALCADTYSAHQAVEHDDANVLCLGAEVVGSLVIEEIVTQFLGAHFDTSPEFVRRVDKLNALDKPLTGAEG
jgi:ribose 5-phosphate isomerase B